MKEGKLAVDFCFYLNHWGLPRGSPLTLLRGVCGLQNAWLTGEYGPHSLPAAQKATSSAEATPWRDREKGPYKADRAVSHPSICLLLGC